MEWGKVNENEEGGLLVNCLRPGHIVTLMVQQVLDKETESKELWQAENMLGRFAQPEECRGTALFSV